MTVVASTAPAPTASSGAALLSVEGLVKEFPIRAGLLGRQVAAVHAVSGVSFEVQRGKTLGLVGESGCGKSTTGRVVMRLLDATAGTVRFDGIDVHGATPRQLRTLRRRMQIVFQDPYASLNPRMTIQGIISEPLRIHGTYDDGGADSEVGRQHRHPIAVVERERREGTVRGVEVQGPGDGAGVVLQPLRGESDELR